MGVCMSVTPDEAKRQAEEKAKADAAAATLLMGVPSLAPGDNDTVLKPEIEDADRTTLTKEKGEKPKSTSEIGDLDSEKGHDFWSLFWAVVMAIANPKNTWQLLPDRIKKPITSVTNAVVGAVEKVAGTVEERVVDPIVAKKDQIADAVTEKVDAAKDRVVGTITDKVAAFKDTIEEKIAKLPSLREAFHRLRANSSAEHGDKNLLPMREEGHKTERARSMSEKPSVNPKPDPNTGRPRTPSNT